MTDNLRARAEKWLQAVESRTSWANLPTVPTQIVRDLLAALVQCEQERDTYRALINDDGSLGTVEDHVSILQDAMQALNTSPDLVAQLWAMEKRAEAAEARPLEPDEVTVGFNGQNQIVGVWRDDAMARANTDYRVRCKVTQAGHTSPRPAPDRS